MNKFLFKSFDTDLSKNVINKLDMLLTEQRHQRVDLAFIKRELLRMEVNDGVQKQVDQFYEQDPPVTEDDKEPD